MAVIYAIVYPELAHVYMFFSVPVYYVRQLKLWLARTVSS